MNILVCVKPALAGADSAMVTREKAALEISRQDLLAYSCALWLRRQAGGSVTNQNIHLVDHLSFL